MIIAIALPSKRDAHLRLDSIGFDCVRVIVDERRQTLVVVTALGVLRLDAVCAAGVRFVAPLQTVAGARRQPGVVRKKGSEGKK